MKCREVNNQEVVRQFPLVSIKYLLFDTASLFKVTGNFCWCGITLFLYFYCEMASYNMENNV